MSSELKHVSGTHTCAPMLPCYHYKDTERDVRGPTLEQSESTVQITNGKNLKISCTAVYPKASYVDAFWLCNGS